MGRLCISYQGQGEGPGRPAHEVTAVRGKQEAEAAGNHGFSNLMADRQSAHRKHGWMLKSSITHI